ASETCKIIIGRNESENNAILNHSRPSDVQLWVDDHGSPITLLRGTCDERSIKLAASMTARYSDAKAHTSVRVSVYRESTGEKTAVDVAPANNDTIQAHRIEAKADNASETAKV
ncbi:MAG: hypothetical protein JSV21_08900, partial [Nitrospirota bacterium]